jgi:hypothetical protein
VRAAFQKAGVVVINVTTGITEDIPRSGPMVHFRRWTAGFQKKGEWVPLFEFPFKPA